MKTSYLTLILMSLSLAVSPALFAKGGGMDSGGGDSKPIDEGVAWYLGDAPVRYCLEVSPDFGIDAAKVRASLKQAFATWKDYVLSKHIHRSPDAVSQGMTLALDYSEQPKCDGSEELKLYFGGSNAEIESAKKSYNKPVALAHRTSYDLNAGRAKGFIWVAPQYSYNPTGHFPDWNFAPALTGILLHELGHALGCGHVDGTIMDENIIAQMQLYPSFPKRAKAVLESIDDTRELFLCESCNLSTLGVLANPYDAASQANAFAKLMGRAPVGAIRASFLQTEKYMDASEQVLSLSDDQGKTSFKIKPAGRGLYFDSPVPIFAVARGKTDGGAIGAVGTGYRYAGNAGFGTLTALDGKELTLLIERNGTYNLQGSSFTISIMNGAQKEQFFAAKLNGVE